VPHRLRGRIRRRHEERGASTVEMAMYMPILLLFIFATVQGALVYLGNQAASAVAREASRVARTTDGDQAAGERAGYQYAANIGRGILNGVSVDVTRVGPDRVRAVVHGHAQELSPVGVPEVTQTVEGPIEEFREDAP
jgi:Flp pilus assembly protein TadG